jgi:neutral ceramidase
MRRAPLTAGGAWRDITPPGSFFLYGYPHVPRSSNGVHDPLLASALYFADGATQVVIVQADVIWLSKAQVADARARISERTGVAVDHIMVTASHTHSGPVTAAMLSNADDPVVPPPDAGIVERIIQGIADAAEGAFRAARPAEIAIALFETPAIGGNRLDPDGARLSEVPVIALRSAADSDHWLGVMFVNPVHPTVLHEDSTLVSGDFPALCREYLRRRVLGEDCPVLCPLGAAGNQSPRYVVRANTFAEAERLGGLLGTSIERALSTAGFSPSFDLRCETATVELPPRQLPTVDDAAFALKQAQHRLAELREVGTAPATIRSAECALFGAEETLALVNAAAGEALHRAQQSCMPAEIQAIDFGGWTLVGWPGEVFVEFAQQVMQKYPRTYVVTLANGELQGYLVTAEAVRQKCYEAGNAVFASPTSGERLVDATLNLLSNLHTQHALT